jgi:hypothetical protein
MSGYILNSATGYINSANTTVNSYMEGVASHSIGKIVLYMVIILYASLVAPKISSSFAPVISNMYFRVAFMSLIAWLFTKDPTLSILVSVGYYLTISYLTKNSMVEVEATGHVSSNVAQVLEEGTNVGPIESVVPPVSIPAQIQQQSPIDTTSTLVQDEKVPFLSATGEVVEEQEYIPEGLSLDIESYSNI